MILYLALFLQTLLILVNLTYLFVEVEKIKKTILETPGVVNVHDLRTRKVGDSIIADVHIEVKGTLTVAEGHAIAVEARNRVMRSSRVLNLMTHIDPV